MNDTFNFEEIVIGNGCSLKLETIIRESCKAWEGITFLSHNLYIKLILVWFVIGMIAYVYNPKMKLDFDWHVGRFTIPVIHVDTFYIYFIQEIIVFVLIAKIINAFYINFFIIQKKSLMDFINMIMK